MRWRALIGVVSSLICACGGTADQKTAGPVSEGKASDETPGPISLTKPRSAAKTTVLHKDLCDVPEELRRSCKKVADRVAELWIAAGHAVQNLRDDTLGRCLAFRWPEEVRSCAIGATSRKEHRACSVAQSQRGLQVSKEMMHAWWDRTDPCPKGCELVRLGPDDGNVASCYRSEDAVRHGSHVRWRKDGSKDVEGRYENGKRAGTWTSWDANAGCWSQTGLYVAGKRHGSWVGWRWGEPKARATYEHGTLIRIEGDDYWLTERH